jgi:hypothetical protein
MSDERVETLVHRISWDSLDLDKLRSMIVHALTDDEIDDSGQSHPSPSRRLLFLWREASAPPPAANDSLSRADRR